MVHALTSILAVINNDSIPSLKTLLLCYFGNHNHHVTQKLLVSILCKNKLTESIPVFGDHQEVSLRNRVDVSEGETLIIFIDDVSWNLLGDYPIKDSDFLSCSSLRK